jgi:glycopeptide antibiotics resistance protein
MGIGHMKNQVGQAQSECAHWSNRLLIASLAGISYLTLFPFQFELAVHHSTTLSPFLLGESLKQGRLLDFFLNILLFIPFGFAISCQIRRRSVSRVGGLILVLAAGAFASYAVELLQYYIPTRNSSWDDVAPNSIGALAGFLIFESCGDALMRKLSKCEDALEEWLSPPRTAMFLLVYFGLWFGVSILLQRQTRLSDWDPRCGLFVGNDASGQNAWKGRVSRLQIWNRAIPEGLVQQLMQGGLGPDTESGLLASYDFTTPGPYTDQRHSLAALTWVPAPPESKNNVRALMLDGSSWLGTKDPVAELTKKIRETNQFTVHIACVPEGIYGTDGRIVSISQSGENANFHLRQEGTALVFWLLNPLSEKRSMLVWYVPGAFEAGQARDIVALYDGSDASIYLDGKKAQQTYRLSAGASLAHTFLSVNATNLDGYVIVYETLVFLPAGILIGIAARKWIKWKSTGRMILAFGLFFPPVLLELILVWVSGREILPGNIFLSVLLSVVGLWMVNSDRRMHELRPASGDALRAHS